MKHLAFLLLVLPYVSFAAPPSWFTNGNTVKQRGNELTIFCHGSGAEKSLSFSSALTECRSIAAQMVRGALFRVQSLTIQTEGAANLHVEELSDLEVIGLDGKVIREHTDQENGEYHSFLQYRVSDISKATVKNVRQAKLKEGNSSGLLQGEEAPENSKSNADVPGQVVHGDDRQLILNIVPTDSSCSILIRGKRPRSAKCTSPATVLLYAGDREILIRQSGYRTKKLRVDLKKAKDETEVLNVYLEKL